MDHSPDHPGDDHAADPTRYVDPMPADDTRLVEQPPPSSTATRNRSLLIGVITALSIGVVAVGVALAADLTGPGDSGDPAPAAVVETGTSTAGSVEQAVASTESSTASATSEAVAAPVTTLTTVPPPAGQQSAPPQVQASTYTPPPGHVDSCAYPNMRPTVVSGTTYTAAPTPTVTVVTAPETCPPYSAGYPWDGS